MCNSPSSEICIILSNFAAKNGKHISHSNKNLLYCFSETIPKLPFAKLSKKVKYNVMYKNQLEFDISVVVFNFTACRVHPVFNQLMHGGYIDISVVVF